MKVLKPQRLGLVHRTFELGGKYVCVVTVTAAFRFDAPNVPIHEAAMWTAITEHLDPEGGVPDEAMHKKHCEVLVLGAAHVVGEPAVGSKAHLQFGPADKPDIDKLLYVFGNRYWNGLSFTDPAPFSSCPILWKHAYGGEDFAENPFGKGRAAVKTDQGVELRPLPNIEDPKDLIDSPDDEPSPVGFGPLDIRTKARQSRAGTYGPEWLEKHFPGLAPDLDWAFFNLAPDDQWLKREFTPGEPFVVEGMHPKKFTLQGHMPSLRARAFYTKPEAPETLIDAGAMRLDTVVLVPSAEMGVAYFRALVPVTEDDARDIDLVMIAAEALAEPKPAEHYDKAFWNRTQHPFASLYALHDGDLLPPLPEEADPMGLEDLPGPADALRERERKLLAHVRGRDGGDQMLATAFGPDGPPPAGTIPDPEKLREQFEAMEAPPDAPPADAMPAELEAELRKSAAAAGIDFDATVRDARKRLTGPPKLDPAAELQKLRDMHQLSINAGVPLPQVEAQLNHPKTLERLEEVAKTQIERYRRDAHFMPEAVRLTRDESEPMRAAIAAARDAGTPLRDEDFTGVDLSEMHLDGVDLEGCFLENASLARASLRGANLARCVLARADLSGTDLRGARLAGTNLGSATLHATNLEGCDLQESTLSLATMNGVVADGVNLDGAQILELKVTGGSYKGLKANQLIGMNLDLSDVDLSGAHLPRLVLAHCKLHRTNFEGAHLEEATFFDVQGDDVRFDRVVANQMRTGHGASFPRASFRGAQMKRANLRETNLVEACFDEADLTESHLSESNLRLASLERIHAPNLVAMRTDFSGAKLFGAQLYEGIFENAILHAADFSRANLFRADMHRVDVDDTTLFDGADRTLCRFKPKEREA